MEDITLKKIIKNAINAAKRDGYNQIIYEDDTGYAFSRDYPNNWMYQQENVVGKVTVSWQYGCLNAKYIKVKR